MLTRLGHLAVRRRGLVVAASIVFLVVAGVGGGGVASELSAAGFQTENAESIRAARNLDEKFDQGVPNLLLLVTAKGLSVDEPEVAQRGVALTQELASEPGIKQAVSYWTLGSVAPFKSKDGRQAMILARLTGGEEEVLLRAEKLADKFKLDEPELTVRAGGSARVFREISTQVESDLRKAEAVTFPVVLILLILVFGSAVAAGLPLGVGAIAVVGTFLVLRVLAAFTDVSIFALNLTTGMGLALGIDYSLFIVSRFREELARGSKTEDAVVRTVETAGRTVAFSALAVAASLSALLAFPLPVMHSFAYAGAAVVAIAAAGSILSLPAVLAMLGPRVNRFRLVEQRPVSEGQGFWHRMATVVMRRPVPIALGVTAVLLLLGSPFLDVEFGLSDDRVLPKSAESVPVHEQIRENFSSEEASALSLVAPRTKTPESRRPEVDRLAVAISRLSGVSRVDAETGAYVNGTLAAPPIPGISDRFTKPDATWLSVVPNIEPVSPEGEELVRSIRALPAPFTVLVGGPSADLVDSKAALFGRVPQAAALIGVVTLVVLFMMTGSILVPIKPIVLNLSLSATFGAMVWIFQQGHLSEILQFTPTGTLDTTSPILMFCVAFGLSMDYEVFLLSRIKEEHDAGADNVTSVALGLERTGRIVTAAAGLLAVVFIAFATSGVTFIKLIGIGMMLAVLMDATLIRAILVPAFMRLAGNANWWAPRPLRRFHDRFGLRESAASLEG